ncbi:hypothetical protein CHS0354_041179 [Potamilus streckersoni]|uniref:Uncharacterized protein n=1 Tax=Potamilus streckersoni TaxID=2493646 RepID=A0AAE0SE21_9BIVA|nr:hypothetical protein CHS0354_041179 [Potamilus streckersoni]
MTSRSRDESSDVFYDDGDYSLRDVCSPVSDYSTYSQEVKYIFQPSYGQERSVEDDYSHIQVSKRKSFQRKESYASQCSHQSVPPPPPPRTVSTASHLSDSGQGYPTHRMSTSAYYMPSNYHQTRRKTWSPEGLRMGVVAGKFRQEHRHQSFSKEHLELDHDSGGHIYEELEAGPPKLTPVSGMLAQSPGRGIIRPIAFKPVVTNQRFLGPPQQQYTERQQFPERQENYTSRKYSCQDDGYGSQDYTLTNHNAANTSHGSGSLHMDSDRSVSFSSDYNRQSDRPDSLPSSNVSRISSSHIGSYAQTPSPSDSGVGELEAMLKEKDAEINTLREVMDKNEKAIFQVYEEKKNAMIKQYHEMHDDYERKMKTQQRKAFKTEQTLSLQIYKLQQEKKSLQEHYEKLVIEKDSIVSKCDNYAKETQRLQLLLDDANFQGKRHASDYSELQRQIDRLHQDVAEKSEEILYLRSKLDETDKELEDKNRQISDKFKEIVSKTEEVKVLKGTMQMLNSSISDTGTELSPISSCDREIQTDFAKGKSPVQEFLKPSLICEKDKEINSLKEELEKARKELSDSKDEFDTERAQWLEEKNKVILYQKQLQLNYVQMYRKNKMLEAEVEQLTLELENRDLKLEALNGGEESVC